MTATTMTPAKATALRRPFPKESIGQLPKGGQMLDFVGHAAVVDRLLAVDPEWSWEPFALDPAGLPAVDRSGNLWIRLTICGVTRIGVGDGKSAKECIGDALRNAAMRFGVALDLWAKENLVEFAQAAQRGEGPPPDAPLAEPPPRYDTTGHVVVDPPPFVPMAAKTRATMFALFSDLKIDDADEQKRGISHIIGRQIVSRSQLTDDEAKQVIAALRARQKAEAKA